MHKSKLVGLVAIAVVIFALFNGFMTEPVSAAAIVFNEMQITSNVSNQLNPDIYEYGPYNFSIVYQDDRNGNWDIYMYAPRFSSGENEVQITTNLGNQVNPKIYEDIIVWQDDRNGNWDIYMYNLSSHEETQITDNSLSQMFPSIYGNSVVYQDDSYGHWRICLCDLTTLTSEIISHPLVFGYDTYSPSIWGNRVAWIEEDAADDYWLICLDLSTGGTQIVTARSLDSGRISYPIVYGNRIAWMVQNKVGSVPWWDINMMDLVSDANYYTMTNNYHEINPDMYGIYIVYERYENLEPHWIYLYNTDSGAEYKIASSSTQQIKPAISSEYGNYLVYMGKTEGNWNIYLNTFGYIPGDPGPSPPDPSSFVLANLQDAKNIIADSSIIPLSDFDGANNHVKEGRRNTLLNKLDAVINTVEVAAKNHETNYQGAINQLNSIWEKMDGASVRGYPDAAGSGATPDWIVTSNSQAQVEFAITSTLAILNDLSQNK